MSLHKPSEIPTLEEISAADEFAQELERIDEFGMLKTDQNHLQLLARSEPYYPIVQIHDKSLLLAMNSKQFKGVIWLSGWVEVDSAYRDKKNVYRVRLRINGEIIEVDYDTLYPKDIVKLSRYGLLINFDYADDLSKYLFRNIAKLEVKEQSDGMGFIMQGDALTFKAYDAEPQLLQYTPNVTLSEYTEGLNRLLTNTAIMFALCCSCASLFLAYLSIQCGVTIQSFIISFYGKSTTGKSTSQTLMASVYTNPMDNQIYIPFFGTLNAIIRKLASKYGIPQLFDEATVSSGLNMESLLYTITLEQDKSRCTSNADLREPDRWKLIAVTSSENMLLTDSRMHNRGLDARLLSFELKFTDDRAHSDSIHAFCGKYYGILGKTISEYLLGADSDEIVRMYDDCRNSMRSAIDDVASFDLAERLINEYALILLSARVLVNFGIHIDITGIIAIMAENHNLIRERTDIADKYYQHLIAYAVLHPYADGMKKDESNNTVAFVDELFIRILESYGASNPDLVIKELDAAGYIFRRKANAIKNRLRFSGTLVGCYEIYLPRSDSESDDGCTTLEYILTHFEGLDES